MYHYEKTRIFKEDEYIVVHKNKARNPMKIHMHDFIEVVYIMSGSGKQWVDNKAYEVSRGSLLFINYGQTHTFTSDDEMIYCEILIRPEAISEKIINSDNAFEILSLTAFEDFRNADVTSPFVKFSGAERSRVENIIEQMLWEYQKEKCGLKTVLKGYLTVLLAYIFRKMIPENNDYDAIPSHITEYINGHLQEKMSLETLAKKCFYSPKYFSKIFKECYGMTVTEYIQKKRIDEGRRLLEETMLPVDEISERVGYGEPVHFYKYFKKIVGVTPTEYRKKKM